MSVRVFPELHQEILEKNNLTEGQATVYLQISRGTAFPRTHGFPLPPVKPTVFFYRLQPLFPIPDCMTAVSVPLPSVMYDGRAAI